MAVVILITVPLVALVSVGILQAFFEDSLVIMGGAGALALICAVVMILKSVPVAREAEWLVDDGGFQSPSIGRCEWKDIVAAYRGLPGKPGGIRLAFQEIIAKGIGEVFDQTIVVRASDGRLLPINLYSPSITGGAEVMATLLEALEGKFRPNSEYTPAEVRTLNRMILNRWIEPKSQ